MDCSAKDLLRPPSTPVYALFIQPLSMPFFSLVVRLPFSPTFWTILCLLSKLSAGALLLLGRYDWLFVVLLIVGPIFDTFDGAIARYHGSSSYWGAYLDRAVDRIGMSWIMACFLVHWYQSDPGFSVLIAGGLVLTDILHETIRTWVALTGGLIDSKPSLPAWDQWLRDNGLLPICGHDIIYFCLAIGAFTQQAAGAAYGAFTLCVISLFYQIWLHRNRVAVGSVEYRYWLGLIRWFFNRTLALAGLGLLSLLFVQYLKLPSQTMAFIAWVEFLIFYLIANRLMSLSENIPENPDRRTDYIEWMKQQDREFLRKYWP